MSKSTLKVRFHYGEKDFNNLLENILKIKLYEIHEKNDNDKHTVTEYHKGVNV